MRSSLLASLCALLLVSWVTTRAEAQKVHEIRMDANPDKDIFRFTPAEVNARPGDVLLFRAVSGTPHSVVFESAGLSGPAREALNGALSRRSADLSSPLLTPNGAEYRVVVPALPPGNYAFFCLPHRAYDMRGVLQIMK
ncbi:MAG: plastocyanin/azurin family copper-binding protein [Gemmatimonadales bacterium]